MALLGLGEGEREGKGKGETRKVEERERNERERERDYKAEEWGGKRNTEKRGGGRMRDKAINEGGRGEGERRVAKDIRIGKKAEGTMRGKR